MYPWVETRGGPALVIERDLLSTWLGVLGASAPAYGIRFRFGEPDAPATDYDRAAEINFREIALLEVGAGRALLVGGDPGPIQVRPQGEGLLLVRVSASNGDPFVEEAIQKMTQLPWEKTGVVFRVSTEQCVLFDATLAGDDALSRGGVTISTPPGRIRSRQPVLMTGRSIWWLIGS